MTKLYIAIAASLLASPAFAAGGAVCGFGGCPVVPEIDAMAGVAALAAVGAAVALVRERTKR